MSLHVVQLAARDPDDSQAEIIAALEEHLQNARNGDITGLIVLSVKDTPKSTSFTRQSLGLSHSAILAALARAQYKFNQDWDQVAR